MSSENSHIEANNSTIGIQNYGGHITARDIFVNSGSQKKINTDEFNLPRLIDTFRGRHRELKKLESLFFHQNANRVVISGLPGMGKSELAKQFAEQSKNNNKLHYTFWIKAENNEELAKSCKPLQKLYQNLKQYKCLFIFDNTISRKAIFELEPPNVDNYYLLITSQAKDWNNDIHSLELDHLTSDSAVEVFKIILDAFYKENEYSLYEEIAEIVNNIPLGLQVTAAYVRQRMKSTGQRFDLQKYVDEIKRNQQTYIDLTIPDFVANPYKKSLYRAVKISIDYVKSEINLQIRELALNTLFVCSFLDPEHITVNDLLKMPNIKRLLRQYKKDENVLREAISFIDNYSFVNFNPKDNEIKLHRFIQQILQHHMREFDSEIQAICYRSCLEVLFTDRDSLSFNSVLYDKHAIILKFTDQNVITFFNFYQKYKRELFLNKDHYILRLILSCLIKWNCIKSLKMLLDDIDDHNTFNYIMCIRQCICVKACTFTYISYFELLHEAARYNNVDMMKLLLMDYKFDVKSKDYHQDTPLHIAARYGNFEAIKLLAKFKAEVNTRNVFGVTPLFDFFKGSRYREHIHLDDVNEILELLHCEDNKTTSNRFGETLLHAVTQSCQAELVTLLVSKYKLDVNAQDKLGDTPLHTLIGTLCVTNNKDVIQTVEILKRCGARLDITDSHGRTAQKLAQERNLDYLVPYLNNLIHNTDKTDTANNNI